MVLCIGHCFLFILHIKVYICKSKPPTLSLPQTSPPWQPWVYSLLSWNCFCFIHRFILCFRLHILMYIPTNSVPFSSLSLVFICRLFNMLLIFIHIYLTFTNKGLSSQGYCFSSGHVWMWELDCEETWAPKNWCFWTVVLEKTLESPLDCKEIQPVHPKGDQSWVFIGRTDAEAGTPILWPPHEKSWLIGKDSDTGRDWG